MSDLDVLASPKDDLRNQLTSFTISFRMSTGRSRSCRGPCFSATAAHSFSFPWSSLDRSSACCDSLLGPGVEAMLLVVVFAASSVRTGRGPWAAVSQTEFEAEQMELSASLSPLMDTRLAGLESISRPLLGMKSEVPLGGGRPGTLTKCCLHGSSKLVQGPQQFTQPYFN